MCGVPWVLPVTAPDNIEPELLGDLFANMANNVPLVAGKVPRMDTVNNVTGGPLVGVGRVSIFFGVSL